MNYAGKMYLRLIKIEAAMTSMMRSSMIAPSVVVNMGALMIKKIPAMPTGLLQYFRFVTFSLYRISTPANGKVTMYDLFIVRRIYYYPSV